MKTYIVPLKCKRLKETPPRLEIYWDGAPFVIEGAVKEMVDGDLEWDATK